MKRNWYLICTKQQQEKKVTDLLTKKGIENFCPYSNIEKSKGATTTTAYQPLFSTNVFVCISDNEITSLLKIPQVVSLVYWLSEPVIIKEEEISAIKYMNESYMNIRLEKASINLNEKITIKEKNSSDIDHNVLNYKHLGLSITLPSLGYTMIAERKMENEPQPQKQLKIGKLLAKTFYPLFQFGF